MEAVDVEPIQVTMEVARLRAEAIEAERQESGPIAAPEGYVVERVVIEDPSPGTWVIE